MPSDAFVKPSPRRQSGTVVVSGPKPKRGRFLSWQIEHTRALKHAQDVFQLSMEIDKEVAHLVSALVALADGYFELAQMNLFNAGLAEAAPPSVEETFE